MAGDRLNLMVATAPMPASQTLLRETVARLNGIATLPEVTAKIIATVEDPKSSAALLNKIVSHDPALVARILKVVNSAFYGLPGQVSSVDRAIVMLGLNAIKNIAVAASLGQMFRGVKLCEGYTAKDLWKHCLGTAVVARELAKRAKLPLTEQAFLCGMIHDIGVLIALQTWPEQLKAVCERAQTSGKFLECEQAIVGVDHAQLGEAVTKRWQFPQSCQLVAALHHHPEKAPEAERALVMLTYIADTLCCQSGYGFPLTSRDQTIDLEAAAAVGIFADVVEGVRADFKSIVESTASLLS